MFEFKKIKTLKQELEQIKEQIYGSKKNKSSQELINDAMMTFWTGESSYSYTLKQRVDDLQTILKKQEKLTHLILEHLKLEYVKVTEENGSTKIVEQLRKITKKKVKDKRHRGDCECCDYAE